MKIITIRWPIIKIINTHIIKNLKKKLKIIIIVRNNTKEKK